MALFPIPCRISPSGTNPREQSLTISPPAAATQRISTLAGNPPQSPPNDLYYSTISAFTPAGGPPQITIPSTSVGFFTPTSLYFGCNAGTPVACTFTVTGSRNNVQTARQTFQFTPRSYPAPLRQAVLTQAGFTGVDKLEFSSVYSVFGFEIPGTTVIDTFSYVITAA